MSTQTLKNILVDYPESAPKTCSDTRHILPPSTFFRKLPPMSIHR